MVIKKKSFYKGIKLMTNTACKIVVQLSALLLCFSSDRFYFIHVCEHSKTFPFSSRKHQILNFIVVESQWHWSEILAWDKLHFLEQYHAL